VEWIIEEMFSFNLLKFKNRNVGPYRVSDIALGEGTTGTVLLATNEQNGQQSALKVVRKKSHLYADTRREVSILQQISHKNIITVDHLEEDENYLFVFTEFLNEKDVWSYIERNGKFNEEKAFGLFKQMVSALEHCHSQQICHHDFKLENCVINSEMELKIIDFGFAVNFGGEKHDSTKSIKRYNCSPAYSALEILYRKPHDESIDIFSLGTCLFYMITGKFPFCDDERTSFEDLCKNVQANELNFTENVSPALKDLIARMLSHDRRPSWQEIRTHEWFLMQKWHRKTTKKPSSSPSSSLCSSAPSSCTRQATSNGAFLSSPSMS